MRFKIVLVPFPFDDFTRVKVRPAMCLTEKNTVHEHIIVAFITSQKPTENLTSDIELLADASNGLKVNSYLRLHKITTLPYSLITNELGEITAEKQVQIISELRVLFKI